MELLQTAAGQESLATFLQTVHANNPGETEFLQAVEEVVTQVFPVANANPLYRDARILHRLTEPDRVIMFRVTWQDDKGQVHVNRGYRVQFNGSIGPYKGGLRFHPSVNLSILKFLGFEQVFKNSLTTLPMGGGKGGANFNPKGKSDAEVMRFCQSFMTELVRHIGPVTDVPAGDIGVGAREIGYLFGQYRRLSNQFSGVLTGKGRQFGGSLLRPEATGYGAVYFAREMMQRTEDSLEGKVCLVSGSGNVAQFTAEKLIDLGAKVVTMSDSDGYIYDADGITQEKLAYVMEIKNERRGRIKEYAVEFGCPYFEGERPWNVPADVAFPCATQNEIRTEDARHLIEGGCRMVVEGANMPTTNEAIELLREAGVGFAPGKAANAGGVAVSGLEMSQNAQHISWERNVVDEWLKVIMHDIHNQCVEHGTTGDRVNYVKGANIAGFIKVAESMLACGVV